MPRGVFTMAIVGVTAALLAVVLVAGISQRDPVATASPVGDAPAADDIGPDDAPASDEPPVADPADDSTSVDTPAVDTPDAEAPDDPAPDDPGDDPTGDDPTGDDPTGDDPTGDELSQLSVVTSFGGITEAGGEVRFEITVTNRGTAPVSVDEGDIQLIGPDGPLESVAGPDRGFAPAELGPRESASGSIVFDVPPGAEGLVLRVAPPAGQPVEIRL